MRPEGFPEELGAPPPYEQADVSWERFSEQKSPAKGVPPHDLRAEKSVLGGVLLSTDAAAEVMDRLRSEHFYYPAHRTIYTAMLELYSHGQPTDLVTVSERLRQQQQLDVIGSDQYLHALAEYVPTPASISHYADILVDKAMLRSLVQVGENIFQLGMGGADDSAELVNRAQSLVYDIASSRSREDYVSAGDILQQVEKDLDRAHTDKGVLEGVPTGFTELDALTNGLHAGQMVVVAARPAMGKSTLALDFARSAALKHSVPTIFFSLEMGRDELIMRLLSAEAGIPLRNIRQGMMRDEDWRRLRRQKQTIMDAPLYIDDSPGTNLVEIRAKCRRLKQRGLGLVVVDYLQLLSAGRRVENRQQEVSEYSRSLKLLAKELCLPLVVLSQLNRGPEQRADKRPMMADLRESGAIEQDADLVMLLHREEYYNAGTTKKGQAEVIVAKHRNGATDTITVGFEGNYSRFSDWKEAYPPEESSYGGSNYGYGGNADVQNAYGYGYPPENGFPQNGFS